MPKKITYSYIEIEYLPNNNSPNYSSNKIEKQYFKIKDDDIEAFKMMLSFNTILEDYNYKYKQQIKADTRNEKISREINLINAQCKITGLYIYPVGPNILKDDIPNEVMKYLFKNQDKKKHEFKLILD